MISKEKKMVLTLVAIMLVILVIVVVVKSTGGNEDVSGQQSGQNVEQNEEKYVTELQDGTKLNNSADLNSTKTYKNLTISNIQFASQNGSTVLLADVTNNGSTTHEKEIVKLTVYGENGEILTTTYPVLTTIAPGATEQLNATVTADIANAKDFKIEAK